MHKNNLSNLVPLCKKCHNQQTYGNLDIKGYSMTSEGKELDYEIKNECPKKKPKKYDAQKISIIMKYKDTNESRARVRLLLNEREKIKISDSVLKKIWDGKY